MTVTMYRNNKLDQAEQRDPDQLAADFVATLKGEKNPDYKKSRRLNLEFEYRWFLSDPMHGCLTWKDEDWAKLWDALWSLLESYDEDQYSAVLNSLG